MTVRLPIIKSYKQEVHKNRKLQENGRGTHTRKEKVLRTHNFPLIISKYACVFSAQSTEKIRYMQTGRLGDMHVGHDIEELVFDWSKTSIQVGYTHWVYKEGRGRYGILDRYTI